MRRKEYERDASDMQGVRSVKNSVFIQRKLCVPSQTQCELSATEKRFISVVLNYDNIATTIEYIHVTRIQPKLLFGVNVAQM